MTVPKVADCRSYCFGILKKTKLTEMGSRPLVARGSGWRAGALRDEGAVCILIMTVAACISTEIHRTGHNEKVHCTAW